VASDRSTGAEAVFRPAAAFIFIGLDPNTSFLQGSIQLDDYGFVTTNDTFETSMPEVFAAADVRAGSTKQLAAAVGKGVVALLHVRQHLQKHSHVSGHEPIAA
jgi:thioredoxin reductase (NADPH)